MSECEHEWEFKDPENIGWEMVFCKKCGHLRGSKPVNEECLDCYNFNTPLCGDKFKIKCRRDDYIYFSHFRDHLKK